LSDGLTGLIPSLDPSQIPGTSDARLNPEMIASKVESHKVSGAEIAAIISMSINSD
jgi:hypothetical protein